VVGAVGSGKSSLLLTLLNEINLIKGDLHFEGSAYYLSQEPWVFSASLKQNILFGKPYVKEKFDKVLKVCCLEHVKILSIRWQRYFSFFERSESSRYRFMFINVF
jgi:ATP-binding cassette subfamily C (CFTR/MRP) protein 4